MEVKCSSLVNNDYYIVESMVLPLWKQIGDYFSDLKFLPDQLEENVARIIEEKKKIS